MMHDDLTSRPVQTNYVPLGLRTNHMTVTTRDVLFFRRPVRRPQCESSLTAGESFSVKIVSLKLDLARNSVKSPL